jgi:hypothetical protein
MITDEDYLGDGLYVGVDNGFQIVLAANDKASGNPTDTVYMENDVVDAFIRYIKRLRKVEVL